LALAADDGRVFGDLVADIQLIEQMLPTRRSVISKSIRPRSSLPKLASWVGAGSRVNSVDSLKSGLYR
jgi:hypothetical protein